MCVVLAQQQKLLYFQLRDYKWIWATWLPRYSNGASTAHHSRGRSQEQLDVFWCLQSCVLSELTRDYLYS